VQAAVHPRAVVKTVSHVFEVFKDDDRILELRDPPDHVTRHFVELVVNEVPLLLLHDRLEGGLPGFLHPLALREVLVTTAFDVRVVEDKRINHITVFPVHRGECDAVLVDVHTDYRIGFRRRADICSGVGDGNMEFPLPTVLEEFRGTHTPRRVVESSREKIVVVGTALQHTFDVIVGLGADAESVFAVVFGDAVALTVIHFHGVGAVDDRAGCAPVLVIRFVVIVQLLMGFVEDLLAGVVDEVGFPNHGVFDVAPIPAFVVKAGNFVAEATGFEGGRFEQLLSFFNRELEGEGEDLLHTCYCLVTFC